MSKLFFDHLVNLDELEKEINKAVTTKEEKLELWTIVDEMIHHKVLGLILGKLPKDYHEEFLLRFKEAPYDEGLFVYLEEKIGENIEELIKQEIGTLTFEVLKELNEK